MKKNIGFIKTNFLLISILVISIACIIMLVVYFANVTVFPSNNSIDWGSFGSYFGSITGLLAFVGVLYSIKQSGEQARVNEERGVFFTMLELYQKQVDNISIDELKGVNAIRRYCQDLDKQLMINLIYKKFKDDNKLVKSNDPFEFKIQESILSSKNTVFNISEFRFCIVENYDNYSIVKPYDFFTNQSQYQDYIDDLFRHHKIDRSYMNIYELMRYTGKYIHINFNLGQYFRNVYYIMSIISKFKNSSYYSKIFRAQLSNSELTLLLYNSLSNESNKEVVGLLIEFDMFNNIHKNDVYFARYYGDINYADYNEIISNPKNDGFREKIIANNLVNAILNEFLKDPNNVK